MIDSSVDLPHPDGPSIATYSPRSMRERDVAQRARLDVFGEVASS